MDPATGVGLAASSAQLTGLAFEVFSNLHKYYRNVRDAQTHATKLRLMLAFLMNLLSVAQDIFERSPHACSRSILQQAFSDLREVLALLYSRTTPRDTTGLRSLQWPFKQNENSEILSKLELYKTSLIIALNIDQTHTLQSIGYDIHHVKSTVVKSYQHDLAEAITKRLDWLCPAAINPFGDHELYTEIWTANTASWIFEDSSFQSWQSRSSLLWIRGKMGGGKTILSCSIINKLKEKVRDNPDAGLAFFYCNGNFSEKRETRYIIGSVIRQLFLSCSLDEETPQGQLLHRLHRDNQAYLSVSNMIATIKSLSKFHQEVYIIIDGIDECLGPTELCNILSKLAAITNIKVLATSRDERDIAEAFSDTPQLIMDESAVQADIATYINWRLNHDGCLRQAESDMKQHIKNRLLTENGGIFRWVQCHLDYLGTLDQDFARRKAIESLPLALSETYKCILDRLSENRGRLLITMKALTWLIYAVRPLTLQELAVAAVINPAIEFDDSQRLDSEELILRYCGSFIKMNPISKVVEISHFSVTQFLTTQNLPDGSINSYYLDETKSHLLLLESCLRWLMSPAFTKGSNCGLDEIIQRFRNGLSYYAVFQWPHHGEKSDSDAAGCASIARFLNSEFFLAWAELWEADELVMDTYSPKDHDVLDKRACRLNEYVGMGWITIPEELYYAARFGLLSLAKMYLNQGAVPDMYGGIYHYPLLAAAMSQKEDIVNLFLDWDADIDVCGRDGESTIFHCVMLNGWWETARRLVELAKYTGSTAFDVHDDILGRPLQIAVRALGRPEDAEVMRRLKLPTLDGSWPDSIWEEPGPFATVLMLIDAGADVNARYEDSLLHEEETPLHWTAGEGLVAVTKALLDGGADPTLLDKYDSSPLHYALEHGHFDVALMLSMWPDKSAVETVFNEVVQRATCLGTCPNCDDSQLSRRVIFQKIAQHRPHDHQALDLLACACLEEYSDREMRMLARSLFDESVESYRQNSTATAIEEILHPHRCYGCYPILKGQGIRGPRFFRLCPDDPMPAKTDNYTRYSCSKCTELEKLRPKNRNAIYLPIPSPGWISRHIQPDHIHI